MNFSQLRRCALYFSNQKKKKEEEEEETIDIYLFFQCLGLQQGNETWRAINKAISFSTMMEDKKLNSNIYNSNVLFNFLTYYVCTYLANEIFQFYIWYMWIWHWQVDIYTLRWKLQMACCMIASHKRREGERNWIYGCWTAKLREWERVIEIRLFTTSTTGL